MTLLDQNEQLFRMLVDSVRDYAIFMLDPTGRVATWNIGAERIKGYRATEIIGRHFSAFYPEYDIADGKCERELETAEREGRFEDENWRIRKDGTRFWANVVISAVRDTSGRLIGFSKVTRDLTERRRNEDERAARFAAENANRAKDDFLAMLGHELRNPLAPIVTALQLIKLRSDGKLAKEHEIIERQVRHMMRLIDDLLDVSRIVRGKIELKRNAIDFRDVIAKAIETASPLFEQRGHQFDLDAPSHAIAFDGDEARLAQVLTNLLVNAAKYTEPGGHIALRVREEDGLVIEVRDDGVGILPEMLPRIFDLFVQGYQAASRSEGGLGLGLSLVRTLTELHGGKVSVHSAGPGTGATFTVRLPHPAAKPASQATAARGPRPRAEVPRKVLIVDDNEDALALLGEALAAAGHDVRTAADPAAALELIRTFKPEVAILDIGLPVMDGYELAIRLRTELAGAHLHLIALTGYGQANDRERAKQAGFDVHFVKPVDVQRLSETVAKA